MVTALSSCESVDSLLEKFKNLNCNARKVLLQQMCGVLSSSEALQVQNSLHERCWIQMLPEDVWFLILKYLSVSDAVKLGTTCKHFKNITCYCFKWKQLCRTLSSAPNGTWESYSQFRSILKNHCYQLQKSLTDSFRCMEPGPLLGSNIHPKLFNNKLFIWAFDSQKVRSGEKQCFNRRPHTAVERPVPIQLPASRSLVLLTDVPLSTSEPSKYWLHTAGSDLFCYLIDGTRGISIIPSSQTGHVGYISGVAFCDEYGYLVTTCSCGVMAVCDMRHRLSELVFKNYYKRPFVDKTVIAKFLKLTSPEGNAALYVSVAAAHTIVITATVISKRNSNFLLSDTGLLELCGMIPERRTTSIVSLTCGTSEVFVLLQRGDDLFVWAASIQACAIEDSDSGLIKPPHVNQLRYVKLQCPAPQLHMLASGRKLLLVSEGIKFIALYVLETGERLCTVLDLKKLRAVSSSSSIASGYSSVHLKCILCHPSPTGFLDGESTTQQSCGFHLRCQWYEAGELKEAFLSCSTLIDIDWRKLSKPSEIAT